MNLRKDHYHTKILLRGWEIQQTSDWFLLRGKTVVGCIFCSRSFPYVKFGSEGWDSVGFWVGLIAYTGGFWRLLCAWKAERLSKVCGGNWRLLELVIVLPL